MKTFQVIFKYDPDAYEKPIWVGTVEAENAILATIAARKKAAIAKSFLPMIGGISVKEVSST